ncbi:chromatin-remodeling ATPase ISW1 KNAG_0M00560 [Huiozyma naganishii CBS 8797]|uniref:Uncharacterized protein n=1 Tax=Huiozyma naganishii (strain ATCC MYA-139 / BCRC 22969 / CBS 8797 / KCTC 17520 / NBRC 10181 / NCYC 3082 / Yp74L-3) TaxID=1071383 RepID=J7SAP0_HUIN7|nr:hypothetical protein KNAG_0M00560 [Kazachstania naganishii CBS 8797]CCK72909.1 hypothetical protein KNAG_0M00560 [Kazachstania naganishii CBS 8797]
MTANGRVPEGYWEQVKALEIGLPSSGLERYLLANSKTAQFDILQTTKRFEHLLSLSGLFRHFIENKAQRDDKFKQVLQCLHDRQDSNMKKSNSHHDVRRARKSEFEEDAELLKEEEEDSDEADGIDFQFRESPTFIDGELRDYQVQGLNWLVALHKSELAGILADEMGLGKTLQTISFLGYLRYIEKKRGPFLVIAPKSTLNNWLREINKWTPGVDAFILQGDKDERSKLIQERLMTCKFDVVIASYEIIIREKASFRKFDWEYIMIDEAHRIKNEESMLSQVLREFTSRNRLLITGTPLQNNLHELWALLNFLLPDIFSESQDFDDWFSSESSSDEKNQENIVKQLHTVLQPFLLRRIKSDVETSLLPKQELNVYVGMSAMQKRWYKNILEKDLDAVNGANGAKESKTRLLNIVMQLRKCCNHPYLFDGAEPGPPYTTDEHLVFNSEKLRVLDTLLRKLRENGSRVLIFSQMSRVLDILEDYCYFRDYEYCRIDGSTAHEDRIEAIDEYNAPDSKKFIFLLTTRAGGLGINLTSADIVVLYDSDWNPQADLQAMDRAHRIGQKKQVKVFRFVTDNSVEEKILERATQKLRLDQLVIQHNKTSLNKQKKENKNEAKDALLSMIQHGAADVFKSDENNSDSTPAPEGPAQGGDFDLDALLARSEDKTRMLNAKYETLGLDDLQNFEKDSAYEWNGTDFKKKLQKDIVSPLWIHPSKRERNYNYSVDGYYKGVLQARRAGTPSHSRMPRGRFFMSHQLQSAKLKFLYEKERMWLAKSNGYEPILDDARHTFPNSFDTTGDSEGSQENNANLLQLLKIMISNAQPLTEEEEEERVELEAEGFPNWTKNEYRKFVSCCAKHGRNSIEAIAKELAPGKTLEEVTTYAAAFWSKVQYVDEYEKSVRYIESEEERIKAVKYQQEALRRLMSRYLNPLTDIVLKYPPYLKTFTPFEDNFVLLMLYKYGIDRPDIYDLMRNEARRNVLFETNYVMRSRSSNDFAKRGAQLLASVQKEFNTGLEVTKELTQRMKEEDALAQKEQDALAHAISPSPEEDDPAAKRIKLE